MLTCLNKCDILKLFKQVEIKGYYEEKEKGRQIRWESMRTM